MSKVFVMLSGGVDSSTTASYLVDNGYEVIAVFMKCWSRDQLEIMGLSQDLYACLWEDDLEDAKLVAQKLKIPFEVWDFQDQYRQKVIEYMLSEYRLGRTPNPDVMCNSTIKFGMFFDKAIANGADFVASGHYARISNYTSTNAQNPSSQICIARGLDTNKDQSYFLWRIQKSHLSKVLFPIGEFENKQQVRSYASQNDLITATKKDSQGLCFVGKTPLRELLLESIGHKDGQILSTTGQILGTHPGSYLYTIGQREKLGLSGGPWFVSKIDIAKNQVIVSHVDNIQDLYHSRLEITDLNWQAFNTPQQKFECLAQIRYRQQPEPCTVEIISDRLTVTFDKPIKSPSVGQSIVFYEDQIMLGGGIINTILD